MTTDTPTLPEQTAVNSFPAAGDVIAGRYQIADTLERRGPTARLLGLDLFAAKAPVIIVCQRIAEADEVPRWPSVGWERSVLARSTHLALPRVVDSFTENGLDF